MVKEEYGISKKQMQVIVAPEKGRFSILQFSTSMGMRTRTRVYNVESEKSTPVNISMKLGNLISINDSPFEKLETAELLSRIEKAVKNS